MITASTRGRVCEGPRVSPRTDPLAPASRRGLRTVSPRKLVDTAVA